MSVNREALKNFLKENGCQDPEGALTLLEPLYQIAESGKYPLAPIEEIYREALIEAVISATSRSVSKVVFISLSNPFPKPDWMTQEIYEKSFRDSLGDSFGHSYLASYLNSLRDNLGDIRLKILSRRLSSILSESLSSSLLDSFSGSLRNKFRDSHINGLWTILRGSLFCYLGYCLLNDQEQIAKLRPLVEILSKCLILGFKQDEPETLLVICK
jgi:hypothetical protein